MKEIVLCLLVLLSLREFRGGDCLYAEGGGYADARVDVPTRTTPQPEPRPAPRPAPAVTYEYPQTQTPQQTVVYEDSYSTVASDVYDAVLDGDISGVSTQLQSSDNVFALAEGLRFPADRRNELLSKTGDRQGDPDVVTLKAVASAALSSRRYYELSRVLTIAVYPEGNEQVRGEIEWLLRDRELMQRILDADPTKEFVPVHGKRRLLCDGCTPVNSFVCAHCWTNVVCAVYHWCPKV